MAFPGQAVTSLVGSLSSIRHIPGIGSSTCKLFGSDPDDVPSVEEVRAMSVAELIQRMGGGGNLDMANRIKVRNSNYRGRICGAEAR